MVDITGGGKFLDEMRYPSTWNPEQAQAAWSVTKEKAKEAGVDVLDWLSETAFGGTENPEGLGLKALAAVSHPLRVANELTMDRGIKGAIPFVNYDPIGALFGLFAGGIGIPAHKWATGEDVTKLDAIVGALTAAGPVVGGSVRGTTSLAKKMVPEAAQESVDLARRKVLKAAGVATGGMLAPVIGAKVALKTAAANVVLVANPIARDIGKTFILSIGKKLAASVKAMDEGVDAPNQIGISKIYKIGDQKASPAIGVRLSTQERRIVTFFRRFKELAERDIGVTGGNVKSEIAQGHRAVGAATEWDAGAGRSLTKGQRLAGSMDEARGYPVQVDRRSSSSSKPQPRPTRIDDELKIVELGGEKWKQVAVTNKRTGTTKLEWKLIPDEEYYAYLRGISSASQLADESADVLKTVKQFRNDTWDATRAFEERWETHLTRTGPNKPGTSAYFDEPGSIRLFEEELNLVGISRDRAIALHTALQDVKWGMAHIEHLERTNPARLKEILTKISNARSRGRQSQKNVYSADMADEMLEALK